MNVTINPQLHYNAYEALGEALAQHGLSWGDLESVGVDDCGQSRLLQGKDAAEFLEIVKFAGIGKRHIPDSAFDYNTPFFAYTKDRIFYFGIDHEAWTHFIGSLPRHPTDKELPKYL
jgi:hypothetical protein